MNYRMIERGPFQVAGLKRTMYCEGGQGPVQEIQQFWGGVGQDGTINRLLGLNNGQITGLIGMTVDYSAEKNELEYWVATEYDGNVPDDVSGFEVPAAKWAVFEAFGPVAEALPNTWQKVYSEWFPSNDYEHADAPSLEVYKSPDPTSPDAKSEIWVPVK